MQLGMIGLGRMGANMVVRLMKAGHDCHVFDTHADAVKALTDKGAKGSTDLVHAGGVLVDVRRHAIGQRAQALERLPGDLRLLLPLAVHRALHDPPGSAGAGQCYA